MQSADYTSSNSTAASTPTRPFEFPDGYNALFGLERLTVPEILFNPQRFLPAEVSCYLLVNIFSLLAYPPLPITTVHSTPPTRLGFDGSLPPLQQPLLRHSPVHQHARAD